MTETRKSRASVPSIRLPKLEQIIEQIDALKADAQKLKLERLAYFLDMCRIEATVALNGSVDDTLGEWRP